MSEALMRRISLMFAAGKVRATTEKSNVQTAQVQLNDMETIDNLSYLKHYGVASRPQPNADAMVLFLGGDRSKGVIIGSADQRYHFQVAEGEVAIHDDQGQSVHITRDGIKINGGGKPVLIENTPKVRMETDHLEVTGKITSDVDVIATPGSISLVHHTHSDPQGGSVSPPK